jgi:hypothetical protein
MLGFFVLLKPPQGDELGRKGYGLLIIKCHITYPLLYMGSNGFIELAI